MVEEQRTRPSSLFSTQVGFRSVTVLLMLFFTALRVAGLEPGISLSHLDGAARGWARRPHRRASLTLPPRPPAPLHPGPAPRLACGPGPSPIGARGPGPRGLKRGRGRPAQPSRPEPAAASTSAVASAAAGASPGDAGVAAAMVATCLQVVGFVTSFVGWIGIIVTTSTNDWVVTCGYTIPTCRKLDELGSKGLWADCVMATGLYHCKPLVDILILPGYVQACRALMIAASVLGLPAILLLLTVLPCIRMGHEPGVAKYRRAQLAGVMLILLALCAIVATIWFPVCAHRETTIVSFGYSLYAGWIGAVLCLVGGCVIVCCAGDAQAFGENRFYYSSGSSSPTHAKSAHV